MFKGFAKWLSGPTVEDVSLEMIGLVKGTQKLNGGQGDHLLSDAVRSIVNRAQKVLDQQGHVIHPDLERFLKNGVEAFKPLAKLPSSEHTGGILTGPDGSACVVHRPNPEWRVKFRAAQNRLDGDADKIFDTRFASKIAAETNGMDYDEQQAYARRNGSKAALVDKAKARIPGLGQ